MQALTWPGWPFAARPTADLGAHEAGDGVRRVVRVGYRRDTGPVHHRRTRSSGEQRGITGKAAEPEEAPVLPFAQVRSATAPKCPQLPKLRSRCRVRDMGADLERGGWRAGSGEPSNRRLAEDVGADAVTAREA